MAIFSLIVSIFSFIVLNLPIFGIIGMFTLGFVPSDKLSKEEIEEQSKYFFSRLTFTVKYSFASRLLGKLLSRFYTKK